MFERKSFDEKKHPFRWKGTRSPKYYKVERVEKFVKESNEPDMYTKRRTSNE